jgi:hypothetical protein
MPSLNGRAKRVRRLERAIRPEEELCPECGGRPGGLPGPYDTFEIDFVGEDEEMPEDVYCETCGELIIGVLRFEDD